MRESGKALGDKIRAELQHQGKSQAWLSEETGIPPGYLSELMNGHPKKRWNQDHIDKINGALNKNYSLQTKDEKLHNLMESVKQEFEGDAFISPLLQTLDQAVKERNKGKKHEESSSD